jgi:hypothetical protein
MMNIGEKLTAEEIQASLYRLIENNQGRRNWGEKLKKLMKIVANERDNGRKRINGSLKKYISVQKKGAK